MADWSDTSPQETTPYTQVLPALRDRDKDAAMMAESPTNPPTGYKRWNTAASKLQVWNGASWDDLILSLAGGGTGAIDAASARTALGLGSMAVQNNNTVSIIGGAISGLTSLGVSGNAVISGTLSIGSTSASALIVGGGITAGTGAIGIVGTDGRIPALSSVFFADLSGANITGVAHVATGETISGAWVFSNANVFIQNRLQMRPTAGNKSYITFTEDGVADRWAIGIEPANSELHIKSGNDTGTLLGVISSAGFRLENTKGYFVENTVGTSISVGNVTGANNIEFGDDNSGSVGTTSIKSGSGIILRSAGSDRLTAHTAITVTVPHRAANGTSGSPSYSFTGAAGIGMWNNGGVLTLQGATAVSSTLNVTSLTTLSTLTLTGAILTANSATATFAGLVSLGNSVFGTGVSGATQVRLLALESDTGTDLVITAGDFIRKKSSSIRYKKNIKSFELDTHNFISALVPVSFDYINSTSTDIRGFIAEEIYTNYPELINLNDKGQPESIRTDSLIAYMFYTMRSMYGRLMEVDNHLFGNSPLG